MNTAGVSFCLFLTWALLPAVGAAAQTLPIPPNKGQQIYAQQCASCHGVNGGGNEDQYAEVLTGDLAVADLAEVISDTMPEEDPDLCVGEDAMAVAAFIHRKFYSPAAYRKQNKARQELSHLTVRQHRESISSIIQAFNHELWVTDKKRGLSTTYYAASNRKKSRKLKEEVTATIDFPEKVPYFRKDRKYEGVKKQKLENEIGIGFSAYWLGGLLAPESGSYEIIVKSRNGFKLFVNDTTHPLIDQWVRSSDDLVHRANVNLLAGRVYTLQLDMFTFKDDSATMELLWKPPHGVESIIPERALLPFGTAEVAVMKSSFPPDDSSTGFRRGVQVTEGWDNSTTNIAMETANWVVPRIWNLAKTRATADDRGKKVKAFCRRFVELAFCKELTEEEALFFVDQHFEDDLSLTESAKLVIMLALKSPRFLYPGFEARTESFERARKLSLFFCDSVPDKKLFAAAKRDKLMDDKLLTQESWRLIFSALGRQKVQQFFHDWLQFDEAIEATKDADRFPGFDDRLKADLKESIDLFLQDVVFEDEADYRELFQSDAFFTNQRLAKFYNLGDFEGETFKPVADKNAKRFGVLTHPFLLSGFSYHTETSPIHRGVFVSRRLLGRTLKQPVAAITPLTEEFDPKMTTRERVAHQTKEVACMACHKIINPLGFSLESFDAVGRFRDTDKDKPVDAKTKYKTRGGSQVAFNNTKDLADFLANNEDAQRNFIQRLFQFYTNQSIFAYGDDQLDKLHRKFVDNNFKIRDLLIDMADVVVKN